MVASTIPPSGMASALPPRPSRRSLFEIRGMALGDRARAVLKPMSCANFRPRTVTATTRMITSTMPMAPTIRQPLRQPFPPDGAGAGAHPTRRAAGSARSTRRRAALRWRRSPAAGRLLAGGPGCCGGAACGRGAPGGWLLGGRSAPAAGARAAAAGRAAAARPKCPALRAPGLPEAWDRAWTPRAACGAAGTSASGGDGGRGGLGRRGPGGRGCVRLRFGSRVAPSRARRRRPGVSLDIDRSPCGRGWSRALSGFASRPSTPIRTRAPDGHPAPAGPVARCRGPSGPLTGRGIWSTIRARGWVAQRQSRRLITARSAVRILPPATISTVVMPVDSRARPSAARPAGLPPPAAEPRR